MTPQILVALSYQSNTLHGLTQKGDHLQYSLSEGGKLKESDKFPLSNSSSYLSAYEMTKDLIITGFENG